MRPGRSKRRLPDSLTRHLSDPKIVVLKPRDRRRRQHQGSERTKKVALSAVTLIVVVLAGGHLLHAW
jgi:hypothetical protein